MPFLGRMQHPDLGMQLLDHGLLPLHGHLQGHHELRITEAVEVSFVLGVVHGAEVETDRPRGFFHLLGEEAGVPGRTCLGKVIVRQGTVRTAR